MDAAAPEFGRTTTGGPERSTMHRITWSFDGLGRGISGFGAGFVGGGFLGGGRGERGKAGCPGFPALTAASDQAA
jgi:hypothetical protein